MRYVLAALLVAFGFLGSVKAAEFKGTFVKFDEPKMLLTVNVDGIASNFTLNVDTKVLTVKGDPARQGIKSFSNPRVAKPGAALTVVTDRKDGKDVVTEVRLGGKRK
jgi:hypothetical protein